jgi:hypothetical protein
MVTLIYLLVLLICCENPVSIKSPVKITVDLRNNELQYYPVIWVKEGTQQIPKPYRMYDLNRTYIGPVMFVTDSSYVSVKYSCLYAGKHLGLSDTLYTNRDTLWRIGL